MNRYIALLWDRANSAAGGTALNLIRRLQAKGNEWTTTARSASAAVLTKATTNDVLEATALPHEAGAIIGSIFSGSSDTGYRRTEMTEADASAAIRTRGRHLIENFWGAYVAFLTEPKTGVHYVVRDCSGKIGCYYLRVNGLTVVFSDINDVTVLGLPSFAINTRYIAGFLFHDDLRIRETGLSDVTELLAGECIAIETDHVRPSALWDPAQICSHSVLNDYGGAVRRLRQTTQRCIDAWASVHDGLILHSLSGGFDSAVVLGCLMHSRKRPTVICFNRYTETPEEDERRYARLAAQRAGVALLELNRTTGDTPFGADLLDAPLTPKPTIVSLTVQAIAVYNEVARENNARAIWTGQGGDHLFLQTKNGLEAADFVHRHGITPRLLGVVADAARLAQDSYWSTLRRAVRLGATKGSWKPSTTADEPIPFVNDDALPADIFRYVTHPWELRSADLPKGQQHQIRLLAHLVNRFTPSSDLQFAPEHHPLISQPIIEACLTTPTYLMLKGGRERALARNAFRDVLPEEIFNRRGKGSTTSHTIQRIHQSAKFFRELLLDGWLVRERIIDRAVIEPYLAFNQPLRMSRLFPLLACVAAEIWVTSWATKQLRAVA